MTITAQRILTELGNKAWSGFNKDDMVWEVEDSEQARTELNGALRYLINLADFPFRAKEQEIRAISGISNYSTPQGQITSIYNKDTRNNLIFIGDSKSYDKKDKGEPSCYWIEYNNPKAKLRLYPIPDKSYTYSVVYNQFKPVKRADGSTSFEFENADDYINMPENLEFLFFDCLVLMTMAQNNKDEQDENYQPILKEFNERWKVFKRNAKPTKQNTFIVGV
jgi:hypothetical protein